MRKFSSVKCSRCGKGTIGKLFQVANVRVYEPCRKTQAVKDLADIGCKARRVR